MGVSVSYCCSTKHLKSQWLKSNDLFFFHVSKGGYDRPSAGLFGDIHAVALGDPLGSLFAKLVVVQTT